MVSFSSNLEIGKKVIEFFRVDRGDERLIVLRKEMGGRTSN